MQRSKKIQPMMRRKINETELEMSQMIELVDKDIKTVIVNIFHMFKRLKIKDDN